jgi:hypothetical protein
MGFIRCLSFENRISLLILKVQFFYFKHFEWRIRGHNS